MPLAARIVPNQLPVHCYQLRRPFRVGSAAGAKDRHFSAGAAGSKTRGIMSSAKSLDWLMTTFPHSPLSSLSPLDWLMTPFPHSPPFLTLTAGLADDPLSSLASYRASSPPIADRPFLAILNASEFAIT